MKKKATPRDVLIYSICIAIIFLTLIDATCKFVDIKYNFWLTAGIAAGTILYVFIIHRVKYAWTSIILLFLVPKPLYIVKFFKYVVTGFSKFIDSVMQNQYIAEEYFKYFNSLIYIALPVLIIIAYMIVVIKKQAVALIVFGGTLISAYFLFGLDNLAKDCNIFLIFSFILYSYNNYSVMWNKWDEKNIKIGKGYFIRVIGINIALILLVNFAVKPLPMDRKPLSFDWFETNVMNRLDEVQGREDVVLSGSAYKSKFSLSFTGYQQDAKRLGGPITDNNSLALKVKSRDDIGKLHLRGTIKDNYNGYLWDKSDTLTLKFHGALAVKDTSIAYQYKEVEITHQGVKTTTAFNALDPASLTNSWKYGFIDSDQEIFNPKVVRPGKSYTVKFKEYNIDQDTLLERSPKSIAGYYTNMAKYLRLSDSIPLRVYELTHSITDKYESPYMKVSAIENYLKKNYPYSKDTSILPDGRDFVDYFLFDEKKGSCSYYASAMAVMARIANVPSRYVEGFVVPYTKDSDGYTDILNSDAHAWVEIYFDNIGWVTFDPTPGNSSVAYQFPDDNENGTQVTTGDNQQNNNDQQEKDPAKRNEKDIEDLEASGGYAKEGPSWVYISLYVVAGIVSLALLLFVVSIIIYLFVNITVRNNRRKVDYSKHKMILYGKLALVPYAEGETLREYLRVLGNKLEISLDNYTLIYEKALYAKYNLRKDEEKEIIDTMLEVRKKTAKYAGKIRFLYSDYINTLKFYIRNLKKSK